MILDYKSIDDIINNLNLSECIITDDFTAWEKFKDYRKFYNKLDLALLQNIKAGPMGTYPDKYPIIFKPIINLFGMSRGFKIIKSEKEYNKNIKDGLFWMNYYDGKQINLDLIILDGKIKTYSAMYSKSNNDGTFDYHEYLTDYKLKNNIKKFVKNNFDNYTGCLNFEIIDDNIIEMHLRLNGDFYAFDETFVHNLDKLYSLKQWNYKYIPKKKYLFPIFIKKSYDVTKIDFSKIKKILKKLNANSLRIDDIFSLHQKKNISRLLMYDIDNFEQGIKAKGLIQKLLYK